MCGESKNSSSIISTFYLLILIYTRITIANDLNAVVEPLKNLRPITSRNLAESNEAQKNNNIIIMPKTGFLQRKLKLEGECTKEKKEIYNNYVGEKNIKNVLDILNYNKEMNSTVFNIALFIIAFNIIYYCVYSICFEPCLKENEPAIQVRCCIIVTTFASIIAIIGASFVMMNFSSSAKSKIENELPSIPFECAPNAESLLIINKFNEHRNGFYDRNTNVYHMSIICFGSGLFTLALFFIKICYEFCAGLAKARRIIQAQRH